MHSPLLIGESLDIRKYSDTVSNRRNSAFDENPPRVKHKSEVLRHSAFLLVLTAFPQATRTQASSASPSGVALKIYDFPSSPRSKAKRQKSAINSSPINTTLKYVAEIEKL